MVWYGWVEFKPKLDPAAEAPLYRQLSDQIAQQIRSGLLTRGERLPATRELAGSLGLNRTTVSAAYEILESAGLISGQVGRGSFVTGGAVPTDGVDWNALLERSDTSMAGPNGGWSKDVISFAVSRPSRTYSRWISSAPPAPPCWLARIWRTFCSSVRPADTNPCGATSWKRRGGSTSQVRATTC